MQLQDLRSYNALKEKDHKLATQVESVYNTVYETINGISGCYNNYTMHDMNHGLRTAIYMENLAFGIDDNFDDRIKAFNAFELSLIILSAILHDIGMFIRPQDKTDITNNNIKYTNSLTFSGVMNVVNQDEEEAIKEIVRITHAKRIQEYMDYDFNGKTIAGMLVLEDKYPYADDIINICVGHGENYDYLKKLRNNCTKGVYFYNPQYISALLRIADYLDLDKQRTPILWYNIMNIEGFSKEEWEGHFIIHNENKLKGYMNNKMQIFFEGKSSNAKIHRKYLKYIDELKKELENADTLLNNKDTDPKYAFNVALKVEDRVFTEGFKYSDLRLNLDYSSITELLMGKNIYGDRRLGLRELIQNGIDACHIMREIQNNGYDDTIKPQIIISISEEEKYVKIKDYGVGMTLDVVKKHFLNVGKSYYKSNEYLYENYSYNPIGQYGIGFLACFLLSDNVVVKTKYYNSNEINQIELEKNSEYVVTNTEETGNFFGTEILLDYSKFFEVFSDKNDVENFLEEYFYTDIPIVLKDDDASETIAISNCCDSIIQSQINKERNSGKIVSISCSEYSNSITGCIKLQESQRHKVFEINKISSEESWYYYNELNNKLELLDDRKLNDGYYFIVEYARINAEVYEKITNNRKRLENKKKEIFAESNEKIYLLFSGNCIRRYTVIDDGDDLEMTINNNPVSQIITNSDMSYYKELVDDFSCCTYIFIHNGEYINLQNCLFEGMHYGRGAIGEAPSFFFYNKGVLVKRFLGISCLLPYAFKSYGYINFIVNGVKLDVSRNYINEGNEIIKNEVSKTILKYMLAQQNDEKWNGMLESIISYNEAFLENNKPL